MNLSSFDYIPCEGCEHNNQRCELLCEGCDDWVAPTQSELSYCDHCTEQKNRLFVTEDGNLCTTCLDKTLPF